MPFNFTYFVLNGPKFNVVMTSSIVQTDPSQCRLSMLESDDWFCDVHRFQQLKTPNILVYSFRLNRLDFTALENLIV